MTRTSGLHRWRGNLRQLPGRTPLRVKMITALLALVIMALAVISVASLTVFRNYQIQRANQQVTELYQQEVMGLHAGHGVNAQVTAFGPYLIAIVPSGTSLARQAANQPGLPGGTPLPDVPTSGAWYKAHGGHLINVGSVSGSDNWQVVAQQFPVVSTNFFGQAQKSNATLIIGVDLGDINGSISRLAAIDLIVSVIIIVGLAIVGVAIVRASLRPLTGHRADRAGHRGGRPVPPGAGSGSGHRGRPAGALAQHHAQPDRVVVLRPGPVRGGRAAL